MVDTIGFEFAPESHTAGCARALIEAVVGVESCGYAMFWCVGASTGSLTRSSFCTMLGVIFGCSGIREGVAKGV